MARILFINQYYWPDEAATAQLLSDLAEDLAHHGHDVTALCGRGRYSRAEKLSAGVCRNERVRVERVEGSDLGRHARAGRLMDGLSFYLAAKARLLALAKHDLVVTMTSPPWVGRLGLFFSRRHGVPLVLWLQDIYPEIAERLGVLRNRFLRGFLHAQAAKIYSESRRIVVPGEDMKRSLASRPETAGKIVTIPNWADLEKIRFSSVTENRFRIEQGWAGDHVLMYSGNMGPPHDTETILALLVLLQKEISSLRFVLVGDTPRHDKLMEQARRMGIIRNTRLPAQPRERLGELLGAADAHLVSQRTETEGLLVPSKFYGIVAAGRPVVFIGPPSSEVGTRVIQSELGVVVEPGHAETGIQAVRKVLFMGREENGSGRHIREWAQAHAARPMRTRRFQQLLEEVLAC